MKRIGKETILMVGLIIAVLFYELYNNIKLKKNSIISKGIITGLYKTGKQSMQVKYTFYTLDGGVADGASSSNVGRIYDCFDSIKGKSFPVVYEKGNLGNNDILILPDVFKKYDIPFPDSLNWVLKICQ